MSHDMPGLIKRYLEERFGYTPSPYEVHSPKLYFDALAHFKLKDHYANLDDAPKEEGKIVFLREDHRRVQVRYEDGQWYMVQDIEDSLYDE